LQHYSQYPSYGNNPDALQLMNGSRKKICTYIKIHIYKIYPYLYKTFIYKMEFYSVIRNDDNMWFEGKWMKLKYVMLSEVSQVQKDKGLMFSLICGR
jgi:hypothetical protein